MSLSRSIGSAPGSLTFNESVYPSLKTQKFRRRKEKELDVSGEEVMLRDGIQELKALEQRKSGKGLELSGFEGNKNKSNRKGIRQLRMGERIHDLLLNLLVETETPMLRMPASLRAEFVITNVEVTADLRQAVIMWRLPLLEQLEAEDGQAEFISFESDNSFLDALEADSDDVLFTEALSPTPARKVADGPSRQERKEFLQRIERLLQASLPKLRMEVTRRLRFRNSPILMFKRDSPRNQYLREVIQGLAT